MFGVKMRDNIKNVNNLINSLEENKSNIDDVKADIMFLESTKDSFGHLSGLSLAAPIIYVAGVSAIEHFTGVEQDNSLKIMGLTTLISYAGYFGFDWLKTKTSNKLQSLKSELKQLKSDRNQIVSTFRDMATLADKNAETIASEVKANAKLSSIQNDLDKDIVVIIPREEECEEAVLSNCGLEPDSVGILNFENDKMANKDKANEIKLDEKTSLHNPSSDSILEAVVLEE
mgnify:CR=1 FL=1